MTHRPAELTLVVPTFNESDNVAALVEAVAGALQGVAWELIVVDDDSPDGTADRVRRLARVDPRVRCLQRIGRRGLAGACIEGMLSSSAPFVAVMDADLQHDPTLLLAMLQLLRSGDTDIVVASRYMAGGDLGDWDPTRRRWSHLATRLARRFTRAALTDPMSGFFMLRRELLPPLAPRLSNAGFKLLLDLFATSPEPLRFRELPYRFGVRRRGESKLDEGVAWDYLMLLLDKTLGGFLPARFISFILIGGLGVVVHLAVLYVLYRGVDLAFPLAQSAATLVAMTGNFALNNLLTYRDRRLQGRAWLLGWLSFVLACSIGAAANVGVATLLFAREANWVLSALAGVLVGAVWNYAVTAVYTWRSPGR